MSTKEIDLTACPLMVNNLRMLPLHGYFRPTKLILNLPVGIGATTEGPGRLPQLLGWEATMYIGPPSTSWPYFSKSKKFHSK